MLPTTQLFELEGKNIQNTRETLLKRVHTQRQPYVAFVRAEPNIRQYTDNRTLPPGTLYVFGQGSSDKTIEYMHRMPSVTAGLAYHNCVVERILKTEY